VKCSVEAAEERDPKGLYEKARNGNIEKFTGINHPFQEPLNPEIVVDTEEYTIEEGVDHVLSKLESQGLLEEQLNDDYSFSITRSEEQELTDQLKDLGYLSE